MKPYIVNLLILQQSVQLKLYVKAKVNDGTACKLGRWTLTSTGKQKQITLNCSERRCLERSRPATDWIRGSLPQGRQYDPAHHTTAAFSHQKAADVIRTSETTYSPTIRRRSLPVSNKKYAVSRYKICMSNAHANLLSIHAFRISMFPLPMHMHAKLLVCFSN